MAPNEDFYTAWDGRQYPGRPPSGWFLAADNRWWPTTDMIGDDEARPPGSPDDLETDSSLPATEAYPAPPATEAYPAPSASWAPEPNGAGQANSEPQSQPHSQPKQQPAVPGQVTSGRRGRRRKFPIWPAVFFFFMLSRCGLFDSAADNLSPEIDPQWTVAEVLTVTNGCSSSFLWGSITNDSSTASNFVVRTARNDGGPDYESDPLLIRPGITRSWVINFTSQDEPDRFCPPIEVYVTP